MEFNLENAKHIVKLGKATYKSLIMSGGVPTKNEKMLSVAYCQLEKAIIVIEARTRITEVDNFEKATSDKNQLNLQDAEDRLITIALARTSGSRTNAASLLGIHIRTLQHKIKRRLDNERKA